MTFFQTLIFLCLQALLLCILSEKFNHRCPLVSCRLVVYLGIFLFQTLIDLIFSDFCSPSRQKQKLAVEWETFIDIFSKYLLLSLIKERSK